MQSLWHRFGFSRSMEPEWNSRRVMLEKAMPSAAIVARTSGSGLEYLLSHQAAPVWGPRIHVAARFTTLREATRAAMRLPSQLRAFALPVGAGDGKLAEAAG